MEKITRDSHGRFASFKQKLVRFFKTLTFVLVALIWVPISAAWATQQLVRHVSGSEVQTYIAPAIPTFDRRSEKEKELRSQYEEALQIAVDKALAEEDKANIEKQLEVLRKKELESPLP